MKLVKKAAAAHKAARLSVAKYMHAKRLEKRLWARHDKCRKKFPHLRSLKSSFLQVDSTEAKGKGKKKAFTLTIDEAIHAGVLDKPLWLQRPRIQRALRCDWKCQSLSNRLRLASHLFEKLMRYMSTATRTLQDSYGKGRKKLFKQLKDLRARLKCSGDKIEQFHAGAMPAKLSAARDAALAICKQTSSRQAAARRRFHKYQSHKIRQYHRRVAYLKRWQRRTKGRHTKSFNRHIRMAYVRLRAAVKAEHMYVPPCDCLESGLTDWIVLTGALHAR